MPDTLSPPDDETMEYVPVMPRRSPTLLAEDAISAIAVHLMQLAGHMMDGATLSESKRKSLGAFASRMKRMGAIEP